MQRNEGEKAIKTTIFAVIFTVIGMNAAVAADHTDGNAIPSPTTLIETTLLPQFKAKGEDGSEGVVFGVCGQDSEICDSRAKNSDKSAA